MIFLNRRVVWACELIHLVSVGGGTKKARGGQSVWKYSFFVVFSILGVPGKGLRDWS